MKDLYDVLFVDFMVEDTHKYYCNALIKAINNYCSSVAVEKYGYLEYKSTERNKIIYVKTKETVNNYPIKARIAAFYNYLNTICAVKNYRFKKIIVLGYDPTVFLLYYKALLKLGDVYVVQHHQLDEIAASTLKRKIWNSYKDKVFHIMLDRAITDDASVEFGIRANRILYFPIPCMQTAMNYNNNIEKDKISVLCISGSNEQSQIDGMIEYEENTHFFEQHNIEIILKEKTAQKAKGLAAFKTVSNFLQTEEYNRLYRDCDIVLMLFPQSYKYRCSGTLIDAFSYGKKVISSNITQSKFYAQNYPGLCTVINNVNDLGNVILKFSEESPKNDILKFKNDFENVEEKCANLILKSEVNNE